MIQSAQVASKFTLFTHHAKTFPDLVTALRNSMLRAGVFRDEKTAAEQVVQVLNFDIHLVKDFRGVRYIERITECIPVEEKNEYTFDHRNETTMEGKMDKFMDNAAIYFGKTTNRELFKYKNILEYVNDTYVLTNPISEKNIKEMRMNMEDADMIAFDKFLERNWGIKPPKFPSVEKGQDFNDVKENVIPVSSETAKSEIKKVRRDGERPVVKKKIVTKKASVRPSEKTIKRTDTTKNDIEKNKSEYLDEFNFEDDE